MRAVLMVTVWFIAAISTWAQTEMPPLDQTPFATDTTEVETIPLELQAAVEAMEPGDYAAAAAELQ